MAYWDSVDDLDLFVGNAFSIVRFFDRITVGRLVERPSYQGLMQDGGSTLVWRQHVAIEDRFRDGVDLI